MNTVKSTLPNCGHTPPHTAFVTSELFWDAGTSDLDNWTQEKALYSARLGRNVYTYVCACLKVIEENF